MGVVYKAEDTRLRYLHWRTNLRRCRLEREPKRENSVVIIGMEVSGSSLEAAAEGAPDPVPKVKPPE